MLQASSWNIGLWRSIFFFFNIALSFILCYHSSFYYYLLFCLFCWRLGSSSICAMYLFFLSIPVQSTGYPQLLPDSYTGGKDLFQQYLAHHHCHCLEMHGRIYSRWRVIRRKILHRSKTVFVMCRDFEAEYLGMTCGRATCENLLSELSKDYLFVAISTMLERQLQNSSVWRKEGDQIYD